MVGEQDKVLTAGARIVPESVGLPKRTRWVLLLLLALITPGGLEHCEV